jgi:hypothetical protein
MSKNKDTFSIEDIEMNKTEFDLAIKGLIEKGLVEEVIVGDEVNYRLTDICIKLESHFDSDIYEQN